MKRSQQFVTRKIVGKTLLVPMKKPTADGQFLYQLNESAAFIWEQIDGQKSVDDIAEKMSSEYEIEPEEAKADLIALLDTFREHGVLLWNT